MARKNSGANGTSVAKVSTPVGKPNQSVEAISERFREEEAKRVKKNYDAAMNNKITFRDPNKGSSQSMTSYTREIIRGYLQAPASNETNLIKVSRYLYYRSQLYFRLVQWYATMWDLRCRQVIPSYDLTKDSDPTKMLKSYNDTLDCLEKYNIQGNWYDVAVKCYTEDVCYSLFFKDDTGSFFYILDPSYCAIVGKYFTGNFAFAIDMTKYKSQAGQQIIEWIGEPLASMWKEYERTNVKYIQVPDEYAACFKFRSSDWNLTIPPMATLFQELASLMDIADNQAIADELSIYKLITLPMKVLSGAKMADDFEISPDLAFEYFNKMVQNALPDYVAAAMVPGDGLDVVNFSDTAADKDVDRYEQSQNTILSTAGGGAVINANNLNNTAMFNAWLKAETEFAISSLLPQIEGFTNFQLSFDLGNRACKVKYFEVSVYTKKDLGEELLASAQYSFSTRLAYLTTQGISEKDALAMEFLENNVLHLNTLMNHPLQSSYTTAGVQGEVGQGRPETPDEELSPSGERSRNS